jgi:hypothetical protein
MLIFCTLEGKKRKQALLSSAVAHLGPFALLKAYLKIGHYRFDLLIYLQTVI